MSDHASDMANRIMRDYRHLMTEAERAADRAFVHATNIEQTSDPETIARHRTAMEQALSDPNAAALFELGRKPFLNGLVRRIVAEHGDQLPRCSQCGEVMKKPNPKQCFDCDYGR